MEIRCGRTTVACLVVNHTRFWIPVVNSPQYMVIKFCWSDIWNFHYNFLQSKVQCYNGRKYLVSYRNWVADFYDAKTRVLGCQLTSNGVDFGLIKFAWLRASVHWILIYYCNLKSKSNEKFADPRPQPYLCFLEDRKSDAVKLWLIPMERNRKLESVRFY